ncbi:MAG: hypothetical protein ACXWZF_06010 [Actinomycetota bacterium]
MPVVRASIATLPPLAFAFAIPSRKTSGATEGPSNIQSAIPRLL